MSILGAGSLTTGDDGHLVADDLRRAAGAQSWIATPENRLKELRFRRGVDDVDWVAVSPSQTFALGDAAAGCVLESGGEASRICRVSASRSKRKGRRL